MTDILHMTEMVVDQYPNSYLAAGALCTVMWMFGVVAAIALNLGWFALLFTVSWPVLLGITAIIILLFFSVLRQVKFKDSNFRYYLMVPVFLMSILLTVVLQIRREATP